MMLDSSSTCRHHRDGNCIQAMGVRKHNILKTAKICKVFLVQTRQAVKPKTIFSHMSHSASALSHISHCPRLQACHRVHCSRNFVLFQQVSSTPPRLRFQILSSLKPSTQHKANVEGFMPSSNRSTRPLPCRVDLFNSVTGGTNPPSLYIAVSRVTARNPVVPAIHYCTACN
jgi:hypothetical protein